MPNHIGEQSKLIIIALCGLKLNESANSIPSIMYLNSSQRRKLPGRKTVTEDHDSTSVGYFWELTGISCVNVDPNSLAQTDWSQSSQGLNLY